MSTALSGPDPAAAMPETLLLGPSSLDIYLDGDLVLPGGGALNMAWHWRRDAMPFHLLTRIGDDRPGLFLEFLQRHAIPHSAATIVGHGASASIDIVIRPDLQPHMDNFVEGVWETFRCTLDEEERIARASSLHVVLVEGAIRELERLAAAGLPADMEVTADFLGFRHYTLERFAETMRAVDVGFVGWAGALGDPVVAGLRGLAHHLGRLVVVTLGSRGVQVFDGRPGAEDRFVPVLPVPVAGTTLGCGDAFIAGFLSSWLRSPDVAAAAERGKAAGAEATSWGRPLPDDAYGSIETDRSG